MRASQGRPEPQDIGADIPSQTPALKAENPFRTSEERGRAGKSTRGRGKAAIWGLLAIPFCAVLLPLLNHLALVTGRGRSVAAVLTCVQLAVAAVFLLIRSKGPIRSLIVAGVILLVVARAWSAQSGVAAGAWLGHAALYSALLGLFTGSLRAGKTPIATDLAQRVRGRLRPDMIAYTRRVTVAWCCYFAIQLLASALLLLAAPVTIWSVFVNILDLPLLAIMFLGEYTVRLIRFRGDDHASLTDMVRAWRAMRARSGQT